MPSMLNTVIHETLSMILVIFLMQQIVQYMLHGFRELSVLTRMRISAAVADWHFHTLLLVINIATLGHRPWMWPMGWPSDAHEARNPEHDVGKIYLFAISFYAAQALHLTATHDNRRWQEMAVHYIVAVGLLLASLTGGYMHTGVVVMTLYSAFEPAFQCARILNLLGLCSAARCMLRVALLVFVVTRIFAMPVLLLVQSLQKSLSWRGGLCILVLEVLIGLHIIAARKMWRFLKEFEARQHMPFF